MEFGLIPDVCQQNKCVTNESVRTGSNDLIVFPQMGGGKV